MAAKPEQVKSLEELNRQLRQTAGLVRDINSNRIRPAAARVESRLEEELKRRKLTTNEPG